MFYGNIVQYLWAPSSLFSWSWFLKSPVSQHPLSSWTNTTAYSIPESQALLLCSLSIQAGMLISFALAWWEMRTVCCTLLYCSVSVDVVVVFVQRVLEKNRKTKTSEHADPHHFLSLETGRSFCRRSLSFNPSVDVDRSARCPRH